MSENKSFFEETILRPVYLEKFDKWAVLQSRCQFKGGQGGTYCRFAGHPCAFKLCPMRMFDDEITVSQLVSQDMQFLRTQIKQINQKIAQINKKLAPTEGS